MNARAFSGGLAVLLAACATQAGYEKMLAGWVGRDELSLVRQWGPPLRSHAAGDRRFLVYETRNDVTLPEVLPSYQTKVKGDKVYTVPVGGSPAMTTTYSCITTFELQGSRVVGSTFSGNDCRAKE